MAVDKTNVLIVEDEPAIIELVTFSLRDTGWNVRSVQNVASAWDAIVERTPHLILLDWMLPDQTGLRLLSRIRADRNFQGIAVIMLTAKSMEEDKIAGLNTGADDYVSCTVSLSGSKIEIGHAEFKLLKFFLAHPERVFSRSQLLDKVWGDHAVIEERTVDVHVLRLRKALKEAEFLIRTVRSVGYMLSVK
jgi:two-component system phosphate regulon response regulator PhoB